MVDLFLAIFAAVITLVGIVASVRLLLHFQDPEESGFGSGIFCKVIVVVSLTLAWLLVLLLPLDVRNSRPGPGVPNLMPVLWRVAFASLAVFLVLVVPSAMFYNDVAEDDTVPRKWRHVLCYLALTLFFSACVVGISYPFLSEVSIPISQYECDAWQLGDADAIATDVCGASVGAHIYIRADLEVYLIAVLCLAGWLLLSIFGGIGLAAAPLDLVLDFVDRPRPIDEQTFRQRQQLLGHVAQALLGHAEELKRVDQALAEERGWRARRRRRELAKEYNIFKRDVGLLEDELNRLRVSKLEKGETLVVSVAKLVLGLLLAILSVAWVLHLVLYVLIRPGRSPVTVFLNALLEVFERSGLYPLGVAIFAVFSFYLLLCVVKGCWKFGMRFFFVFSIHPVRPKATPLSSILFNVELVLISSAAVVQFVQQAFADYTRLTDADILFSAQIKYMKFFGWLFRHNVFVYALLIWALVALIYLLIRPRDRGEVGPNCEAAERLAALSDSGARGGGGAGAVKAKGAGAGAREAAAPRATVIAPPVESAV